MNEKTYNSAERETVVKQYEELLHTLNAHVRYLKEVKKQLKIIETDLNDMLDYYYNEWHEDYEFFKSENHYEVLNQDSIFDAVQDIHSRKTDILKFLVSKLK